MRTLRFVTTTFVAVALLAPGCVMVDSSLGVGPTDHGRGIVGSGHIVTVSFGFRNFRKIYISHAFKARIERGSSYSVRVETDDNIEPYVKAYQSSDEIHIGLEENSYRDVTLSVVIETPDLTLIEASGASVVTLSGFEFQHRVDLVGSGASVFTGSLVATDVVMLLSGSSTVDLTGHAETLDINGSGAMVFRLLGFPVRTCKAYLSGGSVCDVAVSDLLEVGLSGGSVFRYKGNPTMHIISVSGGSVIQRLY